MRARQISAAAACTPESWWARRKSVFAHPACQRAPTTFSPAPIPGTIDGEARSALGRYNPRRSACGLNASVRPTTVSAAPRARKPSGWRTITLLNPVVYLISGFRWSFYEISDVSVVWSVTITLMFLAICMVTVWWIFKTGYKLKN